MSEHRQTYGPLALCEYKRFVPPNNSRVIKYLM